jgi:putative ABC transport system permease protein
VKGEWPRLGEIVVGSDLAALLKIKVGDMLPLSNGPGRIDARVAGIVTTGGEEDKLLFLDLASLQRLLALDGKLSQIKLIARSNGESLEHLAERLQRGIPGSQVKEVRQIARTSATLLKKVQLLMLLVTVVVVIASAGSVTGTLGTTVLERSKEIGLLKAMGGSKGEVLIFFAAESFLLGILGGFAGYLSGVGIASIVTRTVFAAPAEFIPIMVLLSLGVGLFLAIFGSIGPMISVYRLDPVQSLRGE